MKIIDIGCGRKKYPGSIGVDFSSYSDADIVIDLNANKLPFADSSVDFVYSSHCLEHLTLDGFKNIMQEIYRVCKPSGTIYITVPYFQNTGSLANPFHDNKVCFNEHTFRFFSSEQTCNALPTELYSTPSCPQYGLRYSAVSEEGIELRLDNLVFYYFDEYRHYDENTKYKLMKTHLNVVENISYWLKPIKPAPLLLDSKEIQNVDLQEIKKFIEGQIDYLKGQIDWLNTHGPELFPSDFVISHLSDQGLANFINELSSKVDWSMTWRESFVCFNDQLYPYHEVIGFFEHWISLMRRIIDDLVARG